MSRIRRTVGPPLGGVRRSVATTDAAGPNGGTVDPSIESRIRAARGSPLAAPVRREMESAFGADFSAVRIHRGANVDRLAKDLGAEAFATGSSVFFRDGAYQPGTAAGRHLLAHELTHTIQAGAPTGVHRSMVVRRVKWKGQDPAPIDRTIEDAYKAVLKGNRVKGTEEAIKKALQAIEEEQKRTGEIPTWPELQDQVKKQLGVQTAEEQQRVLKAAKANAQQEFADAVKAGDLTIQQLKAFLDAGEIVGDSSHAALWGTAQQLAGQTYLSAVIKPPAFQAAKVKEMKETNKRRLEPLTFEQVLEPEQLVEYKKYQDLARAAKKSAKDDQAKWPPTAKIPAETIKKIKSEEDHKQVARQQLNRRGIPADVLDEKVRYQSVFEDMDFAEKLKAALTVIDAAKAEALCAALQAPTEARALAYLRDKIAGLLIELEPVAANIKPAGRAELCNMLIKKSNDIGDAKGAFGELSGVLFGAREGTEVNTGGENKELPDGQTIGGITDQDVDVRYLHGGDTRVHMEAKWDAATLISKYEGENPKSTTEGTTSTASADTPQKEKPPKEKPPKKKSPQQLRYEALRGKQLKPSGKVTGRQLQALVSNPHDWLRFFVPGTGGLGVSRWLAEAKWTLVVKDKRLSPEQIMELVDLVPKKYSEAPRMSGAEWADATSPLNPDPQVFLELVRAGKPWIVAAEPTSTPDVGGHNGPTEPEPVMNVRPFDPRVVHYLATLNSDWGVAETEAKPIVGSGPGVMMNDVSHAQDELPVEGDITLPPELTYLRNNGSGAMCFVYSLVMSLTGRSQSDVEELVAAIVEEAQLAEGFISVDSAEAQRVMAAIERRTGVKIQVVELQKSNTGAWISGRSHNDGPDVRRPVVVRNTGDHFDAVDI